MSDPDATQKRAVPRGVRRGGAKFPKYAFPDALAWTKKLVSKTHLAPQPAAVVYSGVVGAKGSTGEIRASSLKQFGLLGGSSAAYAATSLAKKIAVAPNEEALPLYREAVLLPPVFKALYETFQGDEVSRAKLKQRAADLNVHPDSADECIEVYARSLAAAGLLTVEGDRLIHQSSTSDTFSRSSTASGASEEAQDEGSGATSPDTEADEVDDGRSEAQFGADRRTSLPPRAVFNVSVTLDSSLDTEKLAKQLDLLKRYGAL